MTQLAAALKAEIARIARKELRTETEGLKKVVARQRTEIAALKRSLQAVEQELKRAAKAARRHLVPERTEPAADASKFRFQAKGLASNRQRLDLSAEDYGLLAGASAQSIYNWEQGKTVPRPSNLPALAALRAMGKREAFAKLEALKAAA